MAKGKNLNPADAHSKYMHMEAIQFTTIQQGGHYARRN